MSSSRPAAFATLLGLLAAAAIPAAAGAAAFTTRITLLQAVYVAVPVACMLGLGAVSAYRRARLRLDRSVRRTGSGIVRAARFFAFAGLYLGVTGALALGFYGVLHLRS
jgi:hypothetical protein